VNRLVTIAALIALLLFGVVTLFRIIQRNRTTDGFKKDLDNVRQVFRDHYDPERVLMDYQPLGSPKKKGRVRRWINKNLGLRRFGGLAYTVAAINSLLAAALAAARVYPVGQALPAPVDFTGRLDPVSVAALRWFVLSFLAQWIFIVWQESSANRGLRAGGVTHAGGVVFRRPPDNAAVEYLIAQSSNNDAEWILPKGHVEGKENHAQTALREVLEETGVRARVVRMIDTVEYKTDTGKFVKVKFYLMEKLFDGVPSEPRGSKWAPYPTVVDELTHEESKHVVKLAEKLRWLES